MKIEIVINTDNDAFSENPLAEVARLLREEAQIIENGHVNHYIVDLNGNTVGYTKQVD